MDVHNPGGMSMKCEKIFLAGKLIPVLVTARQFMCSMLMLKLSVHTDVKILKKFDKEKSNRAKEISLHCH